MSRQPPHSGLNVAPLGDRTLVVQFDNEISLRVNRRVQALANLVNRRGIPGIVRTAITYRTLAIGYDPLKISYGKLADAVKELEPLIADETAPPGKTVHVPVAFGGPYSPDLEEVSARTGLGPDEIIRLLLSGSYCVYMVGFVDGMPYSGDIDARLALPRRANPRAQVRKGSVAIASAQTSIYPVQSPGGWHLLGWTPMEIFNPHADPPSVFAAGDELRYVRITPQEAESWNEDRQRAWDRQWNSSRS